MKEKNDVKKTKKQRGDNGAEGRRKEKGEKREQTIAKNQHPLEKRKEILHSKGFSHSNHL